MIGHVLEGRPAHHLQKIAVERRQEAVGRRTGRSAIRMYVIEVGAVPHDLDELRVGAPAFRQSSVVRRQVPRIKVGNGVVLQGRQFVSSGLSGHYFIPPSDSKTVDRPNEPLPSLALGRMEITRSHEVEFYSDDAAFVVGFTRFIESALEAGNAVIVVVTESHRKSLLRRLQEHGVDIVAAVEQGRYVSLDVAETLSTFMVNDLPDPARFLKVAGNLVALAAKASRGERPRVAACGECAPTLWKQGKSEAAVEVEHLWDEIATSCNVDILCGYVLNRFQHEQENHIYERICAEHSAVSSL